MQNTFKNKVVVITVNLNGEKDTEECVQSILQQNYEDFSLLIVDNGSKKESFEYLQKRFPEINIIRLEKNLGFTGGYNKGIEFAKESGAKYAVLLNNDTKVDKNWLSELVKEAEKDSKVVIVGSKSYFMDEPNVIQSAGLGYEPKGASFFDRGRGEKDNGQLDKVEEVVAVSGVSMLISLSLPEEFIYFDKDFFAYCEDVEICLRAKRAGYKIIYNPKSILWHKVSITSNKIEGLKVYYGVRNRLKVLKKYYGFGTFLFAYLRSWVREFLNLFTFNKTLILNHFKALIKI